MGVVDIGGALAGLAPIGPRSKGAHCDLLVGRAPIASMGRDFAVGRQVEAGREAAALEEGCKKDESQLCAVGPTS